MRLALTPLLFLVLSVPAIAQSDDHALLWRIEGKALNSPSYLYGTIHITKRKVFYFTDSLYAAISATSGFALEVHPDSLTSLLLTEEGRSAANALLKEMVSGREFQSLDSDARKSLGSSLDSLSRTNNFLSKVHQLIPKSADDMPTFMDAYLYGIARSQGKQLAGLERAEDQWALLEQLASRFDPRMILHMPGQDFSIDPLIQFYLAQDLPGIDSMFRRSQDSLGLSIMEKRNHTMLRSMDSLLSLRSMFVAVGVAHLGGPDGLISLLRDAGYRVSPVHSNRRLPPQLIDDSAENTANWIPVRDEEEGYSVQMPGTPKEIPVAMGLKMKLYMDLAHGSTLDVASGPLPMTLTPHVRDSLFDDGIVMIAEKSGCKIIRRDSIRVDGNEGRYVEGENAEKNALLRGKIVIAGQRIYIAVAAASKKDQVSDRGTTIFLESFHVFPPKVTSNIHVLRDTTRRFEVPIDGEESFNALPSQEQNVLGLYTINGAPDGLLHMIMSIRPLPGYFFDPDSTYLRLEKGRVFKNWGDSASFRSKDTVVAGMRGVGFRGLINGVSPVRGVILKRGNYSFILASVGGIADNPVPDTFLLDSGCCPSTTCRGPCSDIRLKDSVLGRQRLSALRRATQWAMSPIGWIPVG